jgi:hypothetical protein
LGEHVALRLKVGLAAAVAGGCGHAEDAGVAQKVEGVVRYPPCALGAGGPLAQHRHECCCPV